MKRWRIAGINFDHFHMGGLLRQTAGHPNAEVVIGRCALTSPSDLCHEPD